MSKITKLRVDQGESYRFISFRVEGSAWTYSAQTYFPKRNTVISKDDILNLKIILETSRDVNEVVHIYNETERYL
jgi:hypothetical protein